MAKSKAVFYFNVKNESGNVYHDLGTRLSAWETKVKDFLGEEYDVLVVPVLNRDTDLFFVPALDGPSSLGEVQTLNESTKKATTKTE